MSVIAIPKTLREKPGDDGVKADLLKVESKLSERMTKMEGELTLVKWMMGIMLAGVVSIVQQRIF
ncbi:MAG: hypothetical protein HQK96_08220 [Nitrospirae bacterium]|nr:hypothetical protein [Nitrospirota bacterium]